MNYYEYFSEIEERFSQRRGSILLLNTLDWALIETWREAGIPLEAVLRGIDTAFDKHDARSQKASGRLRKINGLAWCAQAVMHAAEELVEASTGAAPPQREKQESGFEAERVATYLMKNAEHLRAASEASASAAREIMASTALRLQELALAMRTVSLPLDELDRTLTVLEEKLFADLQNAASEQQLVELKTQADRELAPYRSKMSAIQLRQVQAQFLQKKLLDVYKLPRLSLFYMGHDE